jgi:hypothetical protein
MGGIDRGIEALERRNGSGPRLRARRRQVMRELQELDEYVGSMDADELAAWRERPEILEWIREIEAELQKRRTRS